MSDPQHSEFDEVNEVGTVQFNGCKPIPPSGIEITVSEAWDDSTPRRLVMLTCHGGASGTEYVMGVDKAEALGLLIVSAARSVRNMAAKLDEDCDE